MTGSELSNFQEKNNNSICIDYNLKGKVFKQWLFLKQFAVNSWLVLYTIIFLQFKYRIINYWKYSMIFFIASMCSKFFRIIFTVLIGWSVFDLIPNICSYDHSIFLVGWLVWFDLVWFGMWTLFTFSNTQLEMNSPYFGSEKGDLFLVLPPQIFL